MSHSTRRSRALGAAAGLLADRMLGEPPVALHPVAHFGMLMQGLEHRVYADRRGRGVAFAATGAVVGAVAGAAAGSTAVSVGVAAAGRMLRARARRIAAALDRGEIDRARAELPALVGRDPTRLDPSGIAAAVIESVAENTVDAVVAPALWGATLGAPGAALHRAVNTMDAMVGHRSARYERFGWASARLDDLVAFLPARATAALVCMARPRRAFAIVEAVRRDAPAHPSPNAGVAEASFAAALGLELGGPVRYGTREENRPRLGTGPRPVPADIERAARLADRVELLLVALLVAFGLGVVAEEASPP